MLPLSYGALRGDSDYISPSFGDWGAQNKLGFIFNLSGERTQVPEHETRQGLYQPCDTLAMVRVPRALSRTPAYHPFIPHDVCEVMTFILDGAGSSSTCPDTTAFTNSIWLDSSFFKASGS